MDAVIFWNARIAKSTSSHSPSCTLSSNCIRLAPTEKLSASPVMTKAEKLRTASLSGRSVSVTMRTMSSPMAFFLRMELQAGHAIAQVDQRGAGILPHHAVRRLEVGHARDALRLRRLVDSCGSEVETFAAVHRDTRIRRRRPAASPTTSLTGSPAACIRSTSARTPAASQSSNGPISQLKPARMARSTLAASSAISGRQSAAKFHKPLKQRQWNRAALSFCGSPRAAGSSAPAASRHSSPFRAREA